MKVTDQATTIEILAMIARGDTYKEISKSTGIATTTIADIKKRNSVALATINDRLITHQLSQSKRILDKSQQLINKKLDKAAESLQLKETLADDLDNERITPEEFLARQSALYEPSLSELNALAKEAFVQTQTESGRSTNINATDQDTKQQLVNMVDAINKGDEVQLFKMIINPTKPLVEEATE